MQTPAVPRSHFLDQIRVCMTALVVLHHAAIMFGAPGGWYLRVPTDAIAEKLPMTLFVSVNQSFFMGFFFLLAGYFSAKSLQRKGAAQFAADRLRRLGLPLLVYGFLLGPLTIALAQTRDGKPFLTTLMALFGGAEFNPGPLWFALALLLFSAGLLLWRAWRPVPKVWPMPGHAALVLGVLLVTAAAFGLRLWWPVGQNWFNLQLGYFASYIVLFAAGVGLAPARALEQVRPALARPWIWVSILTIPLLFGYAILAGALRGVPFNTDGGWSFPALAYALWEPLVAWGIILGLLCRFQTKPLAWLDRWAPSAYAAFILHPPVLVGLGLLLADLALPNSLRFALAGGGGVVLTFWLARGLIRIPGVRTVV